MKMYINDLKQFTVDGKIYLFFGERLKNDINGNARTLNTEQETAFDTFVIDQTNRKIYAFRYGYGSDREWSY